LKQLSSTQKARVGELRKAKGIVPMPGDVYIAQQGINPALVVKGVLPVSGVHQLLPPITLCS
jgi:hypothetical protein